MQSVNIFPGLEWSREKLEAIFQEKNNEAVAEYFIKIFKYFRDSRIDSLNGVQAAEIIYFLERFFGVFASPDFKIDKKFNYDFINCCVVISNLTRLTGFINTDSVLDKIFKHPENAIKILTLLSHRNNVSIELYNIFKSFPFEASMWWGNLISYSWNSNSNTIFKNLEGWVKDDAIKYLTCFNPETKETLKPIFDSAFQSTYIFPGADIKVRKIINEKIRLETSNLKISSVKADFKRVAVFSTQFHKNHAVYRSIAPYLFALKGEYHITLFHYGEEAVQLDYELFDDIRILHNESQTVEAAVKYITDKNFGIIFYPDIGMTISSLVFSNLRLAPIQITGSGHPVSSFSAEIDFFIGGKDVEIIAEAEKNYSEQLVLIPGIGMEPVKPDYRPKLLKNEDDSLHILCNWGSNKFYYPHLQLLKEVFDSVTKKIVVHFPGIHSLQMNFVPFSYELKLLLTNERVDIKTYSSMPYGQYMELIEYCGIALDSYHFGGYNRIIDMLYLNKPIVVLEGNKSYNRAAAAILRRLGLNELIAENNDEYKNISIRLIEDENYRNLLIEKIRDCDLDRKIFNNGNEKFFKDAIDYLVKNFQELKNSGKKLIIIPE